MQFFVDKNSLTQTYLLGRIVSNAQRSQKYTICRRYRKSDTFWWFDPFSSFLQITALRHFLQRHVKWVYSGRKYHPVDLFLIHIFAIAAGLGRIENTQSLKHNGTLPPLLGLFDFPHRDTLRTFLLTATSNLLESLQRAHDRICIWP